MTAFIWWTGLNRISNPSPNMPTLHSPMPHIRLYRTQLSGHCHRVELFLSLLGLPFERIEVNLVRGEHRSPAFLARNPLGQVPVIEVGDTRLSDSNATLVYLEALHAPGQWLPRNPLLGAEVQRWFSLSAGPLAQGLAAARAILLFGRPGDLASAQSKGQALLDLMEQVLLGHPYLVGPSPTLADLALYSYTALAPEAGVDLAPWPAVQAWLGRIEALPGFLPMPRQGLGRKDQP